MTFFRWVVVRGQEGNTEDDDDRVHFIVQKAIDRDSALCEVLGDGGGLVARRKEMTTWIGDGPVARRKKKI
ncbi:hypothetical protein OROGR_018287 [Orobanche gracilis]